MIETIQTINHTLAIFGIVAIFVIPILVFDLRNRKLLSTFIQHWGLLLGFVSTLGSSVLTLIYSEYFGIIPCGLCWLERMMLYPQVIILGTALYIKDKTYASVYGIILSVFGLIISLYHHYLQMGGSQVIKCPAAGVEADCAKRFFFEFDFMTFPLMSGILFLFLIVLYTYILKTRSVTPNSSQ